MARHKRYDAADEVNPALDISSLIDVCFLLLIYFLVTSTISPRETDLGMDLPANNPSSEMPPIQPMFIQVDANGAVFVGVPPAQQQMDTDTSVRAVPLLSSELRTYAEAARSSKDQPLVQIYVDGRASYQRVVDVLNALAAPDVNIKSVTFTDLVD